MYFMKQIALFALLSFALIPLWGGAREYTARNMQWVNDFETLVRLDTRKTDVVAGEDINDNGVRDDVESYIEMKFGNDPFQKEIFMEAARKIQQIITLPEESSVEEHIRLDRELLELYTCRDYILYRDEEKEIDRQMMNKTLFKARVLNTRERLDRYIAHKKRLPFTYSELTDSQLQREKQLCLQRYEAIKNPDIAKNGQVHNLH